MAKLVPYAIMLILAVFARITISDDSSSSYSSWNYGGVSSNDVDASSRGYESPTSEENQYNTPPSSSEGDVDSTNTYYESQYYYPPNAGADDSSTLDDVTYASPPDMSSAPSSLETVPNETYNDEPSSPSSYDDSSTPLRVSSSSSSYDDWSTPQSDSFSSSSYDDSSTPQSNSSPFSPYDDSSTPQSDSSSSSSYDDSSSSSSSSSDDLSSSSSSSPTTTYESQSGTEEIHNSVEDVGSGVVGTEIKTEHSGSKAWLVFGVLIGVCAVGATGFIYIKKKRESYLNTNRYISLTRWDRI